jgi:isohexenylglutaconyl-CoA hydratase
MSLPPGHEILLELYDGVLTITLNRPQKRNAMNIALVKELMSAFEAIEEDRSVRAVVIQGAEGHFCAGGDISDMHQGATDEASLEQATWNFNRIFGRLITKANHAPQVVITLLEGAVLGGGFGLACISDVAIADKKAKLALPETGLGIVPAQIAPFVVSRIGLTQARRLALLGERIDGEQAYHLGIAHYVTQGREAMDAKLSEVITQVKRCAPNANAATKELMLQVGLVEHEQLLDKAADYFCQAMSDDESQEGTMAFLEKRLPRWAD